MTRNAVPVAASTPASKVSTMCSLWISDVTVASWRNLARSSGSLTTLGSISFSARRRASGDR